MKHFYVYVYLDSCKGGEYVYGQYVFDHEPFYIGKGCGSRAYDHLKLFENDKNTFKKNKIRKIIKNGREPIVLKLLENLEEEEALSKEIELISLIGRRNIKQGPLTNLTDGGEGVSRSPGEGRANNLNLSYEEYMLLKESKEYCNVCENWLLYDKFHKNTHTCKLCYLNYCQEKRRGELEDELIKTGCPESLLKNALEICCSNIYTYYKQDAEDLMMGIGEYLNIILSGNIKYCRGCKTFCHYNMFNRSKVTYDKLNNKCKSCTQSLQRLCDVKLSKQRAIKKTDIYNEIIKYLVINGLDENLNKHVNYIYNSCNLLKYDYIDYAQKYAQNLRYCNKCAQWFDILDMVTRKKHISKTRACCKQCRNSPPPYSP